ncbi:MAG: PhzF family phenazine biosynthesis isomerase [Gemmatimonadales bacterium]
MSAPSGQLFRIAAFTTTPTGGNPAGVWVGDLLPEPEEMLRIAREVGFSETAFVVPTTGSARTIRFYSALAEVTFCGHATIATGVVLGELSGDGRYLLSTMAGDVPVTVQSLGDLREASLTSVEPSHLLAEDDLVDEVLATLGWTSDELDTDLPPARAYAGAWHLIIAADTQARLDDLSYDFEALKAVMEREHLTTIQLVWRESADCFHARDPFPVGGVVEDPATGAAAAALGGYLRDAGLVRAPTRISIRQGEAMGRPSLLAVEIPEHGGIIVTGTAVHL